MTLPTSLISAIDRAGYFPTTALEAITRAVGSTHIRAFLVRPETTFDGPEVRRHLTVLLLGESHLFIVHLDDELADALNPTQVVVSSERVKLERIHNIALSQVFDTDGADVSSEQAEVNIGFGWGAQRRIDMERTWCEDPHCTSDHGYNGTSQNADIVLRISALVDGPAAVEEALNFFDAMSEATAQL